ncbi:hypothetical protein [Daejeonella sp.]|uniref:HYC_CC_PP family protein n=1 Tax=Daejeonella sp. TaxID=2805397 RepID=UPI0026CACCE5|nr:hypothetical protein [Daejeonella sp.]HQS04439.1 hypothetical protein [Daejeonella sp.]HQT23617.1 hypothetical protein [Daejeonella sp.]HQT56910.1 hypothetical protein [Daejeonella sp.]
MKRIFAMIFAVLLLTTSVGFSFTAHYCGGKVFKKSLSFLGDSSQACNMQELENKACSNLSGIQNKPCCEDHVATIQIKDQYQSHSSALSNDLVFLAGFTTTYFYLTGQHNAAPVVSNHYLPPLLALDIPVIIQSFLI